VYVNLTNQNVRSTYHRTHNIYYSSLESAFDYRRSFDTGDSVDAQTVRSCALQSIWNIT
jgi:hypothetical protein